MSDDIIRVEVIQVAGTVEVVVDGELDIASCAVLRDELDAVAASDHVVIDCSWVTFMDSSGLRVIVGDGRKRQASGGSLTVTNTAPQVRRLFQIAGVDEFLTDNQRSTVV